MLKFEEVFLKLCPGFIIIGKDFYANGVKKPTSKLFDFIFKLFKEEMFHNPILLEHGLKLTEVSVELAEHLKIKFKDNKDKPAYEDIRDEDQKQFEDNLQIAMDPISAVPFIINKDDGLYNPIGQSYLLKIRGKDRENLLSMAPYKVKIFDPRDNAPEEIAIPTPSGLITYPTVNCFIKPKFMFEEDKGEKLHEDHKKFFNVRFTDTTSKEIYFSALYHMITDRMRHCLFLVHPREGTGKTICMGEIPAALLGPEQSASLPPTIISDNFNGILEGKRHILLDEFRLYAKHENLFKKLTEDPLYINAKHKREKNIYNALTIFGTSNKFNIFTLPSNRRNVFLEDSGKHIIEETSHEWTTNYIERLRKDTAFVANLGYWILRNFENTPWGPNLTYKGPTFERMVYETCSSGLKFIINTLRDEEETAIGDTYEYTELRDNFNRSKHKSDNQSYFPSIETVIDFFKDYREKGKPIAATEKVENKEDLVIRRI